MNKSINKLIAIWCCFSLLQCTGQVKHKMEYFTVEKYKDWEIDTDWTSSVDDKFLKKGSERVEIWFHDDKIQVEHSSILHPYTKTYVYNKKTSLLLVFLLEFYQFSIGILKTYDDTGILIKETNYDKPYVFTLQQLIEKIKKEQDIDLEDLTKKSIVDRREDTALQKPIYEVHLESKKSPDYQTDYFLIDGITGEVLFETTYFNRDEKSPTPYYQYLRLLKNKEIEDNSYYKSYKGKNYTKKEWEAFEEEWYRDFEEKKEGRNFFWDNIFKKLNE
ncbi:hypothetical protein [Flavobacterium hercynium]|uniref:Uncharacterized protein n=1 Tax=Flavobacterium hercynium TaxID=387094 RepID=A0A226HMK0_9FLAO|nr:hypothetical protein [Flavobacterium hercynium]OXA94730.1 hypothetical protein B0A66_03105 [Flavobacterium hercynium]SMP07629.1 hypothetical protein SAMN06265346_10252 [Flavobacterium hercynium]